MKKFKDLKACFDLLRSIHARNDTEPEQRKHIEEAMELLNDFRRLDHPSGNHLFPLVRKLTERIVKALIK